MYILQFNLHKNYINLINEHAGNIYFYCSKAIANTLINNNFSFFYAARTGIMLKEDVNASLVTTTSQTDPPQANFKTSSKWARKPGANR
ncbi:MAG TPA: hypothetical protein VFV68_15180 [Agriterribacter sp.]|nr:hypothetical protein [Agriterribacter sp.]